jgi:predicted nucleic acid-binding protein
MTAKKVVDASVLAAFAFGEPRAGEAAILLADAELYSPELLSYELANVAQRKSQRYPAQAQQIASALEAVLSLDISLVSLAATDLLALALERKLSAYDAAYLLLAQRLDCQLVTFDQHLARQSI